MSIRLETQKELLLHDMVSAVQVESERAGTFAGQMPGMDAMGDGDSMESTAGQADASGDPADTGTSDMTEMGMSQMDMPELGPGGLLADDPVVLAAITSFGEAAGSLSQLMAGPEQQGLDGAMTAHNDFVVSIAALDVQVRNGEDAMSFYHGDTQLLEAALRASLQDLQSASSIRLQSSIDDVISAGTLLRWAVPLLLLGGIVAVVYLLRAQATKQRIDTLEHLVDVKGKFIAAVSHELRTPLTAVVGFADLLRRTGAELSPSDRAEMIATIADQSEEVTAIVDDLLAAAQTDIGGLTVAAVPVDLRAQTAQVLESIDRSRSITVVGQAPTVSGDPARVRQILRNLFTNAIRYGGDHISVELGSHSDALASLAVKDDGEPIATRDRERIFEPYQRAHNQTHPESLGLGLAVFRRLARLMGGDLAYRHQDGHSIFQLSLPVAAQTGLESHRPTAAATAQ